jgi:hypothetical protein
MPRIIQIWNVPDVGSFSEQVPRIQSAFPADWHQGKLVAARKAVVFFPPCFRQGNHRGIVVPPENEIVLHQSEMPREALRQEMPARPASLPESDPKVLVASCDLFIDAVPDEVWYLGDQAAG